MHILQIPTHIFMGSLLDAVSGNTLETLDPRAGNMEELSENRAYLSPPMQAQTHIQAVCILSHSDRSLVHVFGS
ncbi:hypothetical protein PVL29_012723 [Vitis rotundifolia]|uniref:Uncharacterized protein n=1 Tax=Vitis rotundifolia TaxID=103349 RepID=A0AA38ZL27_VITRO|nr:hypothetical protein PVL29_012723 [Vitis rotundifolia]